MITLIIVVVSLFAFASSRNSIRKVSQPNIKFVGENNLFVTYETVSKLLIQNHQDVKNMPKETLDLNLLENALNSNPMIKSAEVYVTVNGVLNAEIEQKKPIARVSANASYYIDDEGFYMPLSSNYTARVPLVTGIVEKNNLTHVFKLAQKIEADVFLKKHVIEIQQTETSTFFLKFRKCNFTVQLGSLKNFDKKIMNLKAFYNKALKEKSLNRYS